MKLHKSFQSFVNELNLTINEGQFSWMTLDTGNQIGSERENRITVYMYDNEGNRWEEKRYEGYGEFGGMDYYELLATMNGYSAEDLSKGEELRDIGIDLAFDQKKFKPRNSKKVLYPALVEDPKYNWKRHDFEQEAENDPNQSWYQEPEYDDYEDDYYESKVTEAKFVKDFNRDVLDAKTKDEVLKLYPNAEFFIGKSDHFFGELDANLFFKAYYTKGQKEFEIKSIYSEKGSNYVHLYNESVVTEAKRSAIHKAAKQGSYPVTIVVIKDGEVISQELVKTPEAVPAAFNVIQSYHKHKGATVRIESKTGETLFTESVANEATDFNDPVLVRMRQAQKHANDMKKLDAMKKEAEKEARRNRPRWTQKKYDKWLETVASNGGAENAFDMAKNAEFEPGLIDWVKKEFRGDDPLQRIQWDIEGFAESVVNEAKSTDRDKMIELVSKKGIQFAKPSEEFDGVDGGIWIAADNGEKMGGKEIFDYYSDSSAYEFGVLKKFIQFIDKHGYYAEYYDPGTIMLWQN